MTLLRIGALPDTLVAPVLVVAFDGWVDAAGASSAAAEHLADGGVPVVTFDDDRLFDYRSRRPTLDIIDGTLHRLQWPSLKIHHRAIGGRDLLILHGPEPDFRWQELGDAVGEFCLRAGVVEWISLGAIPAAVPHTRPVPVLATASRDGLLHEAEAKGPQGLLRVPSAALSSIELPVTEMGVPAVGFYAQVPHYVGGPYAAASVSLLRHLVPSSRRRAADGRSSSRNKRRSVCVWMPRSRPTRTCRRSCSASNRAPRRSSRPETSSRPRSSASCADRPTRAEPPRRAPRR